MNFSINKKSTLLSLDCKKYEDSAIGIINACNSAAAGSRMIVSHFREFMADEDDEEEEEDIDYDYDY